MTPEVADVIGTFRMLAQLPRDSMGAYVISMSHTASDVLAVVLLQKECGGERGGARGASERASELCVCEGEECRL